jgi:endonuclease YncB( thermonuclease family)
VGEDLSATQVDGEFLGEGRKSAGTQTGAMRLRPCLLLGLLLVGQAAPSALAGPDSRATVLSIGDGDTIRVLQGQQRITVRLACNRCAEA